jgi:hypothetical protein
MNYKLSSSKEIVARVYRNFKIQGSDWIQDVPEWIGDVYPEVGGGDILEKVAEDLTVDGYRVGMPCGLESIEAIEYNGERLPYGGDATAAAVPILGDRTTNIYNRNPVQDSIIGGNHQPTETLSPVAGFGRAGDDVRDADYYQVNPGYIITSFESGTIRVHYQRVPTDKEGYPMVPDNAIFKNACAWYILHMILAGGYQHPVFNYESAEARWIEKRDEARASVSFSNFDRAVSVARAHTRLTPIDFQYEDFGAGSENMERLDI